MDFKRLAGSRRFLGNSTLVALLSVVVLVNIIINALVTRFSWYLYTEERYEHTVGAASETLFADVGNEERVRVIFCTAEETLEGDTVRALVLNTFRQLAERHAFLTLEFVNIYLNPSAVRDYTSRTTASGETVTYTLSEDSVILVSDKGFRVESLSSFFILNGEGVITAYNGEEFALAAISWVLADSHPLVGFTHRHGENFSELSAFSTILMAAGYDMTLLDLTKDVPADVAMVVIANPRWDLDRGAGGIDAELDRLAAFLDRGGHLFVSLDPYAKSDLTGLRAFLADRGLSASQDIVYDAEASVTYDGYTLGVGAAPSSLGTAVWDRVGATDTDLAIVSDASVITCTSTDRFTAEPILVTSKTSKTYKNGVLTDEGGSYPVLAVSHRTEGGVRSSVILTSSVYLLANDVLNSAVYENRGVLLATLEETVERPMPVGCTLLPVGNERLEGLTMKTARLYAVLLTVAVPLTVAAVGVFVTVRRKIR
ncbi:MAG: Gldg family protein [Clostridia bacterium]|nr:Gldg family protein [Clostridia bacterium]